MLACSEAAKLFIHYLAATANDACKDAKRQTVSADDVLTALDDLEFGELAEPLKAALEGESRLLLRSPSGGLDMLLVVGVIVQQAHGGWGCVKAVRNGLRV